MTTINNNNTIDKFGRSRRGNKPLVIRGQPGVGFKFTNDSHYDIQGKCLKNVGEPVDGKDSATRNYVDQCISMISQDSLGALKDSVGFTVTLLKNYADEQIRKFKEESLHEAITDLRKQMEKEDNILMEKVKNLEKDIASKGMLDEAFVNHDDLSNAGISSLHKQISL